MYSKLGLMFFVGYIAVISAQTVKIVGWVVDKTDNSPLKNVRVKIAGTAMQTHTDAHGMYVFDASRAYRGEAKPKAWRGVIVNSSLRFDAAAGDRVTCGLVDMRGRTLGTLEKRVERAGEHSVDLRALLPRATAGGTFILMARIGGQTTHQRVLVSEGRIWPVERHDSDPFYTAVPSGLAKKAEIPSFGRLVFFADGYLSTQTTYGEEMIETDTVDTVRLVRRNGVQQCAGEFFGRSRYEIEGDTIVVYIDQAIDSSRECIGDELVITYDTTEADTSRIYLGDFATVGGDTLIIKEEEPQTIDIDDDYVDDVTVQGILVMLRDGNGSGMVGRWKFLDRTIEVIEGEITDSLMDELMLDNDMGVAAMYAMGLCIEITPDSMHFYGSPEGMTTEEDMKYMRGLMVSATVEMMQLYSEIFDITIETPTDSTIVIKGNISGEVVTITIRPNLDMVYSSTNPSHATTTVYYVNPVSCPNDVPEWFDEEFLMANIKIDNFDIGMSKTLSLGKVSLPRKVALPAVNKAYRRPAIRSSVDKIMKLVGKPLEP